MNYSQHGTERTGLAQTPQTQARSWVQGQLVASPRGLALEGPE